MAAVQQEADNGAAPSGARELPKPGRELGSYCNNRSGPKRVKLLRPAMFQTLTDYVSPKDEAIGITAYLRDMLELDPRWFLAQLAKLEPKTVNVDTTERSFRVVMIVDEAPPMKRIEGGTDVASFAPSNATEQTLSDVVAEAAQVQPGTTKQRGGTSSEAVTGPIRPASRPSTAPPLEPECPPVEHTIESPPAHISDPSEVVSDFSTPVVSGARPPRHPVTRCPRCGSPVVYAGLFRGRAGYRHPAPGSPGTVLVRDWAKCPDSHKGNENDKA